MPQVNVGVFNPSQANLNRVTAALDYFIPHTAGETDIQQYRRWIKQETARLVSQHEKATLAPVDSTIMPD